MGSNKPLFKTTIEIWTRYDGSFVDLSVLAEEADTGAGYCSRQSSEKVDPQTAPDEVTSFFYSDDEEEPGD